MTFGLERLTSSNKDAIQSRKLAAQALAYFVDGPPLNLRHTDGEGCHNALSRLENGLRIIDGTVETLADFGLTHHNVEANQSMLSGNDHDRAVAGRVNGAAKSNVRKVGNRNAIDHAPKAVGRLSNEFQTDSPTEGNSV